MSKGTTAGIWLFWASLVAMPVFAAPQIAKRGVRSAGTAAAGSGIAMGSAFVVTGTELGPAEKVEGTIPYGTELAGVRVRLQGPTGVVLQALIAEAGASRVVAILPSGTATGEYQVAVERDGESSNSVTTSVVERNPGLATGTGSNHSLALAWADGADKRLSLVRPARPGQRLEVLAAGFGPIDGSDAEAPGERPLLNGAVLLVGTTEIPVEYAGRHPERPGYDRVIANLPGEGLALGCVVPVRLRADGRESEPAYIPLAADDGPCDHPDGISKESLLALANGEPVTFPGFSIFDQTIDFGFDGMEFSMRNRGIGGSFTELTLAGLEGPQWFHFQRFEQGGCTVVTFDGDPEDSPEVSGRQLDAGDPLRITGPSGFEIALPRKEGNSYAVELPGGGLPGFPFPIGQWVQAARQSKRPVRERAMTTPELLPGEYKLAGTGGDEVAAFEASLNLSKAAEWSNRAAINEINRSSDLVVTWTPGPARDAVLLFGMASTEAAAEEEEEVGNVTAFYCQAPADRGSLSVPAAVLQRMPVTAGLENAFSALSFSHESRPPNGVFRAPLTDGKQTAEGAFTFSFGRQKSVTFK